MVLFYTHALTLEQDRPIENKVHSKKTLKPSSNGPWWILLVAAWQHQLVFNLFVNDETLCVTNVQFIDIDYATIILLTCAFVFDRIMLQQWNGQ